MSYGHKFDVNDDVLYQGKKATVVGLFVINDTAKYFLDVDGNVLQGSVEECELTSLDVNSDVLRFVKETYSFLRRHEDVKGFYISLGSTGVLSVDITTNVTGNFDFDIDSFNYKAATKYINDFVG